MLPIKHSAIFRSRWIALLWAAGIVWTAVQVADGQKGPDAATDNGAAAVANDLT